MNLPNKLTLLRVLLIPVFVVFMLVEITQYDKWIALGIFAIASLTDLADGKIARKYNLITNFDYEDIKLIGSDFENVAVVCFENNYSDENYQNFD
mgnify:CR=1 FL=1